MCVCVGGSARSSSAHNLGQAEHNAVVAGDGIGAVGVRIEQQVVQRSLTTVAVKTNLHEKAPTVSSVWWIAAPADPIRDPPTFGMTMAVGPPGLRLVSWTLTMKAMTLSWAVRPRGMTVGLCALRRSRAPTVVSGAQTIMLSAVSPTSLRLAFHERARGQWTDHRCSVC